jgi:hypothetical protein
MSLLSLPKICPKDVDGCNNTLFIFYWFIYWWLTVDRDMKEKKGRKGGTVR